MQEVEAMNQSHWKRLRTGLRSSFYLKWLKDVLLALVVCVIMSAFLTVLERTDPDLIPPFIKSLPSVMFAFFYATISFDAGHATRWGKQKRAGAYRRICIWANLAVAALLALIAICLWRYQL